MPIRKHLPGFWWFREGQLAGVARPGFNGGDWAQLEVEGGGVLLSWLGKLRGTHGSLESLREHLVWYREMVFTFHEMREDDLDARLARFEDPEWILAEFAALKRDWSVLDDFSWTGDGFELQLSRARVRHEAELLREHGFDEIVSLVEQPPCPEVAETGLIVHHLPIADMSPPTREQTLEFAAIAEAARRANRTLVVHCLAGIGRTATMLMAGGLHAGETLDEVRATVEKNNPRYGFRGAQWEFLRALASDLSSGQETE